MGETMASYPLLDDTHFKGTLSLPHYPGNDGYWWTGVSRLQSVNVCRSRGDDRTL